MQRRSFLAASLAATAAAGWLPPSAEAIEPIERKGEPHFKFSLAAYSYRSLLSGKNASLTLHDFIDDCAKMGLEGTELTSYYFPEKLDTEYVLDLKRHCFRQGLSVSGTAIRCDFGYPPGPERDRWITHTKTWVDHAAALGAPVIRIFAGHHKPDVAPERSHRLMVEGMQQCCDYAATKGVYLALENHGGPTATAEGLLKLVRDVESPWFGVNLDTGNFHSEDIYGELAQAAPYAVNVQVKVVVSGPNRADKRPADFKRLASILKDTGYRGFIVLEYEEAGDPRVECPKHLEQLRAAFS